MDLFCQGLLSTEPIVSIACRIPADKGAVFLKILIVSLFLPEYKSRHAGGRYVYELLRYLAQRHEIHLAVRHDATGKPLLDVLKPFCAAIHPYPYAEAHRRGVLANLRLIFNYLGFSCFAHRLIRSGGYDVVQVEWVETALLIGRGKTPMVLDAHDVITKPAERRMRKAKGVSWFPAALKYILTRSAERHIMRRFASILTVSEYDRRYLLQISPELTGRVTAAPIPAGMDIGQKTYEEIPNTILFLAAYKHRPVNVEAALWFYREVYPLVRRKIPETRFIIAGNGPPEILTSLATTDSQVEVTGYVDDLDQCYKQAAVFVAPILTGGGIIVKILDALAAGRPVVTTSIGNEGVGARPGHDLLVADDPEDFAASVVKLLREPEYARSLGARGTEFVRQNYGLENLLPKVEQNLLEVAKVGRQP